MPIKFKYQAHTQIRGIEFICLNFPPTRLRLVRSRHNDSRQNVPCSIRSGYSIYLITRPAITSSSVCAPGTFGALRSKIRRAARRRASHLALVSSRRDVIRQCGEWAPPSFPLALALAAYWLNPNKLPAVFLCSGYLARYGDRSLALGILARF